MVVGCVREGWNVEALAESPVQCSGALSLLQNLFRQKKLESVPFMLSTPLWCLFFIFPVFSLSWLSPALSSSLPPLLLGLAIPLRSFLTPPLIPGSELMEMHVHFSRVQISSPALAFKPGSRPLS